MLDPKFPLRESPSKMSELASSLHVGSESDSTSRHINLAIIFMVTYQCCNTFVLH